VEAVTVQHFMFFGCLGGVPQRIDGSAPMVPMREMFVFASNSKF
jgi:hypothetical protein